MEKHTKHTIEFGLKKEQIEKLDKRITAIIAYFISVLEFPKRQTAMNGELESEARSKKHTMPSPKQIIRMMEKSTK